MSTFTSTDSGIVLSSISQNPATIASGAFVTDNGTSAPHSGDAIYGTNAAAWTIANLGTVVGNQNSPFSSAITGFDTIATPDPGWQVKEAADFTGHGAADILLQNSNTNQVYLWGMTGA